MTESLDTGINIQVHDHLTAVLVSYAHHFTGLHAQLEAFKKGFGGVAGPRNVSPGVTKAVQAARDTAKITVINARTEGQIANIKAKSGQLSLVSAEKLKREVEKTKSVTDKAATASLMGAEKFKAVTEQTRIIMERGSRQAIADGLKREAIISGIATKEITHVERITQLRQRGIQAELMGEEKIQSEMLRQLLTQERINKLQQAPPKPPQLTNDQKHVQNGVHRIQNMVPQPGDLITYGQGSVRRGLTGIGGFLNYGHREPVHELQREQAAIGGLNLSAKDNDTLYGGARRLRTSMGIVGLDQASALEVVRHVHGITANADESVNPALMGTAAKFTLASKGNYGHSILQLQRAMQSAELMIQERPEWKHMSKAQVDEAKVAQIIQNMDIVYKLSSGSAGMNKPSETKAMLTYMRTAKIGASPQALYDYSGIMRERNGAGTGMMLQSTSNGLINLHTTDQALGNIIKAGLLDASSKIVHFSKGKNKGKVDFKESHLRIKGFAEANENQFAWFNHVVKPMVDKIEVHGKDGKLDAAETIAAKKQFLDGMNGNRLVRDELQTMYFQNALLKKESDVTRKAAGIEQGYAQQPAYAKADARFEAAKKSVIQAISPAVMEQSAKALNLMAGALEGFANTIEAHPWVAKLGAIAFGLGSIGSVMGGVALQIGGAIIAFKALRAATALTKVIQTAATGGAAAEGAAAAGGGIAAGAVGEGVGLGATAGAAAGGFWVEGFGAAIISGITAVVAPVVEIGLAIAGVLTGPVIAAIAVVGVIGTGVWLAWKSNFLGFKDSVMMGLSGIKMGLHALGNVAVGTFHMAHGVWTRFSSFAISSMRSLGSTIASAVRGGLASVSAYINASPLLKKVFGAAGSLVSGAGGVATGLVKGVGGVVNAVGAGIDRNTGAFLAGAKAFDASNPAPKPLFAPAMAPTLTLMQGGLNGQAQSLRDRALGIPTLRAPSLTPEGNGNGMVHMPITVHVNAPAGAMTPEQARQTAKKAGRILEDTVHHHLTNGARQPTQTAPNRLR